MTATEEKDSTIMLQSMYDYSYTEDSGKHVEMAIGEKYTLLEKSNEDWWRVQRTTNNEIFFAPANYLEYVNSALVEIDEEDLDKSRDSLDMEIESSSLEQHDHLYDNISDLQKRCDSTENEICDNLDDDDAQQTKCNRSISEVSHDSVVSVASYESQNSAVFEPPEYANLATIRAEQKLRSNSENEYANLKDIQKVINIQAQAPVPDKEVEPLKTLDEHWEMHQDESTGRYYYYNIKTQESSWKPPRLTPKKDSDEGLSGCSNDSLDLDDIPTSPSILDSSQDTAPSGYTVENVDGATVFINDSTKEKWHLSYDSSGRAYYYTDTSNESCWELPEVVAPAPPDRHGSTDSGLNDVTPAAPPPPEEPSRRVTNQIKSLDRAFRAQSLMASFKPPGSQQKACSLPRNSTISPEAVDFEAVAAFMPKKPFDLSTPIPFNLSHKPTEKRGLLYKTKLLEGNKKVKKNWVQSYAVVLESKLIFYKDQKSAQPTQKSAFGKPESVMELSTADIVKTVRDYTTRRNCLRITSGGSMVLIQLEDKVSMQEWFIALKNSKELAAEMASKRTSSIENILAQIDEISKPPPSRAPPKTKPPSSSFSNKMRRTQSLKTPNDEKTGIRDRLRKLLSKRPSVEVLEEKGIIQSPQLFGSDIKTICEREKSTVPSFVLQCIAAIETNGLDHDGIYRINGNVAQMQKLRFMIDHNESYDLNDGNQWDIHVLTGALKLFFRELKEPLIPYEFYDKLRVALGMDPRSARDKALKDLIKVLPKENYDTARFLFRHMIRVIDHKEQNRMQPQNMAIVFGPTLMAPKIDRMSMAVSTVFQNQLVEYLISNFDYFFS